LPDNSAKEKLTAAVLDGPFESPPWSSFLEQLRELTGANFATLMLRPPGRPYGEALSLFAGELTRQAVDDSWTRYNSSLDFVTDLGLEEGRVYRYDELYPPKSPVHLAYFHDVILAHGIYASRMVRLMEPAGISGWLAVSRQGEGPDFGPEADALIAAIAPILRGALRFFVALEHEHFTAKVTGDAMRRLHFGWMALDAGGHVVEHDSEAGRVFSFSKILSKGPNGLLNVHNQPLKQRIFEAIASFAAEPQGRARAFTLNQDPWLDMLLMSATHNRLSAHPRAAIVGYIHGDSWQATDRHEQLVQLFNLSRSEARLALALSRGMTITQAAGSLGIQIGTARKCSKLIYAKTGAGGLPDLVRIVMRSVLSLAPKD
jgi:DNA-binding CsgD family transcriptional regulator